MLCPWLDVSCHVLWNFSFISLQGQWRPFKSEVVKDDFLVAMGLPCSGSADLQGPTAGGNQRDKGHEEKETKVVDELCPEPPREQGLVGDRGRDREQEPLWGLDSFRHVYLRRWEWLRDSQAQGVFKVRLSVDVNEDKVFLSCSLT